jgi:hypothetical protein
MRPKVDILHRHSKLLQSLGRAEAIKNPTGFERKDIVFVPKTGTSRNSISQTSLRWLLKDLTREMSAREMQRCEANIDALLGDQDALNGKQEELRETIETMELLEYLFYRRSNPIEVSLPKKRPSVLVGHLDTRMPNEMVELLRNEINRWIKIANNPEADTATI